MTETTGENDRSNVIFLFFFFFPSTLIDARRGICGKKKETVVEEKIEAIKRKKTNKNNR